MANQKTVRMWNDSFETVLTDIPQLTFLDFDEEKPEIRANTLEVRGRDGVLVGTHTYAPFKLILRFVYEGHDIEDYNLLKQRLRSILHRKDVFYINHSDRPGVKYAVYTEENAIEDVYSKYGKFEISFNVYKGYSESLNSTLSIDNLDFLPDDTWQFEQGVITQEDIKYKHTTKRFSIYNGGEEIDPLVHRFNIIVKGKAPNGFRITNHHLNITFEYTGELKSYETFTLIGVHPVIDERRVGAYSNWEFLGLKPGMNNIEVEGNGFELESIKFDFDYIYR